MCLRMRTVGGLLHHVCRLFPSPGTIGLFLNVIRPANVPANAKLPVLVVCFLIRSNREETLMAYCSGFTVAHLLSVLTLCAQNCIIAYIQY